MQWEVSWIPLASCGTSYGLTTSGHAQQKPKPIIPSALMSLNMQHSSSTMCWPWQCSSNICRHRNHFGFWPLSGAKLTNMTISRSSPSLPNHQLHLQQWVLNSLTMEYLWAPMSLCVHCPMSLVSTFVGPPRSTSRMVRVFCSFATQPGLSSARLWLPLVLSTGHWPKASSLLTLSDFTSPLQNPHSSSISPILTL